MNHIPIFQTRAKILIGIDTGTNTGLAVYDRRFRQLVELQTLAIHQAMAKIEQYYQQNGSGIFVRVEDARKRKWIPKNTGRERLQGAGSVKRDAKIWEDFLTDLGVPFEMVAPKNNRTKMDEANFKLTTGWFGRCSGHARDAAWLVYGL